MILELFCSLKEGIRRSVNVLVVVWADSPVVVETSARCQLLERVCGRECKIVWGMSEASVMYIR